MPVRMAVPAVRLLPRKHVAGIQAGIALLHV